MIDHNKLKKFIYTGNTGSVFKPYFFEIMKRIKERYASTIYPSDFEDISSSATVYRVLKYLYSIGYLMESTTYEHRGGGRNMVYASYPNEKNTELYQYLKLWNELKPEKSFGLQLLILSGLSKNKKSSSAQEIYNDWIGNEYKVKLLTVKQALISMCWHSTEPTVVPFKDERYKGRGLQYVYGISERGLETIATAMAIVENIRQRESGLNSKVMLAPSGTVMTQGHAVTRAL